MDLTLILITIFLVVNADAITKTENTGNNGSFIGIREGRQDRIILTALQNKLNNKSPATTAAPTTTTITSPGTCRETGRCTPPITTTTTTPTTTTSPITCGERGERCTLPPSTTTTPTAPTTTPTAPTTTPAGPTTTTSPITCGVRGGRCTFPPTTTTTNNPPTTTATATRRTVPNPRKTFKNKFQRRQKIKKIKQMKNRRKLMIMKLNQIDDQEPAISAEYLNNLKTIRKRRQYLRAVKKLLARMDNDDTQI